MEYFNTINVIKAILYFGEHTKCKLYRTRLQLMLFYYEKEMFDKMHFKKIDLSDTIFVIDVNGYIGNSTKKEIEYARKYGKEVIFMSEFIKKEGS